VDRTHASSSAARVDLAGGDEEDRLRRDEPVAVIDFRSSAMLAGRVRGPEGEPVVGARVEIVDPSSGQVLDDAVSVAQGDYRLRLLPELDFQAFQADDLVLRAADGRRRPLAEVGGLTLRPSEVLLLDLDVTGDRLQEFEPVATPLERTRGPLLDEGALRTIEAAISGLASIDERRRGDYLDALHKALPELATYVTVADEAFGVLEGDPDAAERFRRTIGRYDRAPLGPPETVFGLGLDLLPRGRFDKRPLPHPRNCGIALSKFGLLVAAALTISDSAEAAFARLGELELGLAGLQGFESLYADATLALGGDDGRLLDGLDRLGSEPFPPPSREPPFSVLGVCEILRHDCAAALTGKLKRPWVKGGGFPPNVPIGPAYTVTSLVPADGCPGSTIVIKGTNFGAVAGKVCFPAAGSGRVCVDATSWTDTEVYAVVPSEAAAGTLTLEILEYTVASCGATMSVSRQGTGAAFTGGATRIVSLSVAGKVAKVCVEPATAIAVAWSSGPAGAVAVHLRIAAGPVVLLDQSGLQATGSISFTTPAATAPSSFTVTVTATGACGTDTRSLPVRVDVVPKITVDGIEVTQGIQTFGRAGVPDNSLPVVSGKDTIVRVYLSADRKGFNQDKVDDAVVTLDVDGVTLSPINGITPANPGGGTPLRTIGPKTAVSRGKTNDTVNFRIPAFLCGGTRQLFVFVVASACGGNTIVTASKLQSVTWQTEPALRVRYVRITDNRPAPAGTGSEPTDAQARFTVLRAFDLLPTASVDIAPAITATWTTTLDFTTLAGLTQLLTDVDGNHDAWEWIFSTLGLNATPAQDHALWIALTNPFNRGLADRPGNTAVAAMHTQAQGQTATPRVTPAHEIAHNLDFMHVNVVCGTQSIVGPFYAHPNNGVLQDVPFDPFYNQALAGTVQDFMSYGCTVWTSGDSWDRLLGAI
jgi:hypothetical protein